MSQSSTLLDLSITLTQPPQESPSEVIASIAMRCDALGLNHSGDLLTDPLTKKEREELCWYLEEYWKWPYEQFLTRGKQVEALLPEVGKRLYKAVFGSFQVISAFQTWRSYPNAMRQLSIMSDIPAVLSLPWELLHDEQGFLALLTSNPVSIIRRLPQGELATFPTPFAPPLRILLVTARPEGEGIGFLDPRSIAHELLDEVQAHIEAGSIDLEFLRPPTLGALRARLKDAARPVHILHFDGHGIFEGEVETQEGLPKRGGKQGKLAFENEQSGLNLVEAEELAQVLQDSGVRLAMLDACQSAVGADDVFSSVATRLIQGGVDAVVAMSASVLVVSSTHYFVVFYRELAAGTSVPVAQERARQALHDDPQRHVNRRSRDEEGKPVQLLDWWLPHFYQQRPFVLRATRASGALTEAIAAPAARLNEEMPGEPRYGFSGRARELLQIERQLMRGKLVVIHGFGGVGKTALAREAADWLTRTKMYEGACFVSFEHGGDVATLLSALGHFLGVYDSTYNPNDPMAALGQLKAAFKERRTLVIADNLESILPSGEAPLEAGARGQLWEVLLELTKLGAGMLLTSHNTYFGDERMLPGENVSYLQLGGLYSDDAYALASRLLENLGIDRARTPYKALLDLLRQLDYHPLSIQLVLPTLRELPLSQIASEFAALLPMFVDTTETGRNQSLSASLEYSLKRLSAEQRALLPRLAVFEGGALETGFLAITKISQSEWVKLRPALEQAGLLTAEGPYRSMEVLMENLLKQLSTEQWGLLEKIVTPFADGALDYTDLDDTDLPPAGTGMTKSEWAQLRPVLRQGVLFSLEGPFLRFHPVLTPFLRSQPNADDATLREHYVRSYFAEAKNLFIADLGNPLVARTAVRWELPNLRRALELLLEAREVAAASKMAENIAHFLHVFGLWRERDELRRRVEQAVATTGTQAGGVLPYAELRHERVLGDGELANNEALRQLRQSMRRENVLGDGELAKGNVRAANARFTRLLECIEARQEGTPLGRGSFDHCLALSRLANCLSAGGQAAAAEMRVCEALVVLTALLEQQPEHQDNNHMLGQLLTDLGDVLQEQGKYAQARQPYEKALKVTKQQGDLQQHARALGQLGTLEFRQEDYPEAQWHYTKALELFHALEVPANEALVWHQLGIVAQLQGKWSEAERCYREGLALEESLGDTVHAAAACSQLAMVAEEGASRPREAEGWYKRALELYERVQFDGPEYAIVLGNLAQLLINEMLAGHAPLARIAEAKDYAGRALAIEEGLDASAPIWTALEALAKIAELENKVEIARDYRRRERETFAAFAGNRYHIDQHLGQLIADSAAAAKGDVQAREKIEALLPELEKGEKGRRFADATRRIWAGERDWHALVEGVDRNSALLVLLVLETID